MKESNKSMPRAGLAAVLIVGAGAAGFFIQQHLSGSDTSTVTEEPTKAGPDALADVDPGSATDSAAPGDSALGAGTPGSSARRIPDELPDITLADRDGKPTRLSSFAGRPLMVNFWATWCAPCRREIPLLNKLRAERRAENAEIVGIAVDFRDDVLEFVKTVPLSYPLLIGEEDGLAAAEAFGMGMAFPFSIFVDSQNRILTIRVGELHEDEANFAFDRLRDIDEGKLTREAAQKLVADAFREMAARRARTEGEKSATPAS